MTLSNQRGRTGAPASARVALLFPRRRRREWGDQLLTVAAVTLPTLFSVSFSENFLSHQYNVQPRRQSTYAQLTTRSLAPHRHMRVFYDPAMCLRSRAGSDLSLVASSLSHIGRDVALETLGSRHVTVTSHMNLYIHYIYIYTI